MYMVFGSPCWDATVYIKYPVFSANHICRHTYTEADLTEASGAARLKILGKHSAWHAEINTTEVQLKLYVCMGPICSI